MLEVGFNSGFSAALFLAATEVAKLTEVINLKVIDEVNLGGDQNSTSRQRNIHRIRSKAAFERLGGKKPPIDFDKMDLVIVKGWLGCAKGNVEIATEEQVVVFSVQMVDHCRHADAILCVTPYVGQFAVSKHTDICVLLLAPKEYELYTT